MEKRIALEGRGRNPSQVKDLNLDNCRSTSVVGLTDAYVNLHSLSLINVGLTSLKGFPKLPNLKRLELSDNRICSGLNLLSASPKLAYLNLSGNKINDLETLKPLKEFNKLKNLDLFNNDVTAIEDYRTKVFNLIPTLKYLDGFDQQDREADDSDGEEDELNGNEESSEEDLGQELDFAGLIIDDNLAKDDGSKTVAKVTPFPLVMYTIYGLLFHSGVICRPSGEFDEEEEDEELSLSAVYNDQLGEESSEGDFEVSYGEEAEDEDDEDGEEDEPEGEEQNTPNNHPEESTRGKKRKLEESEPSNN